MTREALVKGVKDGVTAYEGLMAHGRGEAFDYLLGERTHEIALSAMRSAVATLLLAQRPVLSINGNVVALCPKDMVDLAKATGSKLEANIFYRTEERVNKIVKVMKGAGAKEVLGQGPSARIKALKGPRGKCSKEGIFKADVVFVPLEDGDRTEALVKDGKTVITVDLNPLSRTAMTAQITIVDNIIRAVPRMTEIAKDMKGLSRSKLKAHLTSYDNKEILALAVEIMASRLKNIAGTLREGLDTDNIY